MADTTFEKCAIVILAAGKSSRFGSPKQLLPYKNKSLLSYSVEVALETGCKSVYAVLGASIELMREELKDKPVIIIENKEWEEGIASSIRCGVRKIMETTPMPDCVIFMVCDQPFITGSLLVSLLKKRNETGLPVVAGSYNNINGTPALFHKIFFPALMQLKDDKGAGKLIADYPGEVATVPFPGGITDIDTVSDYEQLKKENDR
jgi:molybdenum cofactor cytidylyltransferase